MQFHIAVTALDLDRLARELVRAESVALPSKNRAKLFLAASNLPLSHIGPLFAIYGRHGDTAAFAEFAQRVAKRLLQ